MEMLVAKVTAGGPMCRKRAGQTPAIHLKPLWVCLPPLSKEDTLVIHLPDQDRGLGVKRPVVPQAVQRQGPGSLPLCAAAAPKHTYPKAKQEFQFF